MPRQPSSMISGGAGLWAPSETRHVARYVTATRIDDPTGHRRRLADRVAFLLAEARRCGDVATAKQILGILQGVGRRSRAQARQERRMPEA